MTRQHFTQKELLVFGLEKTRQHAWFLVCSLIIGSIIFTAVEYSYILNSLVIWLMALSVVSMSLVIAKEEPFTFSTLFASIRSPKITLKFTALSIVYTAAVLLGLVALVAPGIYIAVRFKFFPYVLLENENMEMLDIAKHSYELTEGIFVKLLTFFAIAVGLNILGLLCFGIGLLVTLPVTIFATAHLYKKLHIHA
jgi:uncharacterized membrane protein